MKRQTTKIFVTAVLCFIGYCALLSSRELSADAVKTFEKQVKSKNPVEMAAASWQLAGHYRATNKLKDAEKLLKDLISTREFDRLPKDAAIEKLCCILEMAHIKALQNDVVGSLALLNWAEQRKDDYQRAVTLIKYGEILLDLDEFDRAEAYRKNSMQLIQKHLASNVEGAAIGQGKDGVDQRAVWRELKLKSDALLRNLEFARLKGQYGVSYALYVKLRRYQFLLKKEYDPILQYDAFKIVNKIVSADPKSQFAEAAKYLKGEILAYRLTDESDKKQIKAAKIYLEQFIRENPEGLYRGEALMLLGKISLEIEWDAKESEKYYQQALKWFQKARQKQNAIALYTAMSDELLRQTEPTQKLTSLNHWKRIVYHDEDPLKLYNTENSPTWYIDDREKNCVCVLGLIKFAAGDYGGAWKYWSEITKLDADQSKMDSVNFPNLIMRLREVCEQKEFMFTESQRKSFSDKNKLRLLYAELLHYEEKFYLAQDLFERIAYSVKGNDSDKAAAYIGLTTCSLMSWTAGKTIQERMVTFKKYPEMALRIGEKTPIRELALRYCALFLESSSKTRIMAIPYYKRFIEEYPSSKYAEEMLLRLGVAYAAQKDYNAAERILKQLKREDFIDVLSRTIKFMKGEVK